MKQLTEEQAIEFVQKGEWKNWSSEQIVAFQLFQDRLCVDFSLFQKAMQDVLGRPVWTHEFAYRNELIKEYQGLKNKPTMSDIINLIPAEKLIVVSHD